MCPVDQKGEVATGMVFSGNFSRFYLLNIRMDILKYYILI
jgi:hypothetical protein